MHHVVVERWSRQSSWLHSRDARGKLAFTVVLIVCMATTHPARYTAAVAYAALLLLMTVSARLPLWAVGFRAGFVLPFSAGFALLSWLGHDPVRSAGLVWKSYLSALAVLLLVSSTPLVDVLKALEWFRAPRLIVLVAQFLYRYLFVISEQAQHMLLASRCRAGAGRAVFARSAGSIAVLFARSYGRAEGIQRAMSARGFAGHFPSLTSTTFGSVDALFVASAALACAAIRFAS